MTAAIPSAGCAVNGDHVCNSLKAVRWATIDLPLPIMFVFASKISDSV